MKTTTAWAEAKTSDTKRDYHGYGDDMVKEGEGRLDAQGRLEVTFDVPPLDENQPYDFTYRLEAQVTDRVAPRGRGQGQLRRHARQCRGLRAS